MCEHCKPDKQALSKPGHPHEFIIDDGAIFYYDSLDGWEGEKIDYCPYCNQRLTPEEPLTLEELKEMDGEPVWVSVKDCSWIPNNGYWCIMYKRGLLLPNGYTKSLESIKGWTIYRHKPIEEEKGC